MKGFPNQIAEIPKLTAGIQCLAELVDQEADARDDGVFGQALVRAGVAGTGHRPIPVEDYIANQLTREPSRQSFRTTARGLRQLYRLLRFIDDSGPVIEITNLGRRAAAFAGSPINHEQIEFWRRVIRNMTHADDRGLSHPYQVLLRLIARKPGITRAKCALALEAIDDSPEELNRIVELADMDEIEIRHRISVSKSNWDNAKKVLPRFAEQLGDVIRTGQSYVIADAPGRAEDDAHGAPAGTERRANQARRQVRAPRTSREVTRHTIAQAGTAERSDEVEIPITEVDPIAVAAANELRSNRLRRHNQLVQEFAAQLETAGAHLYETPFDILALFRDFAILIEVKSLDGTAEDERERVRDALGQLLYYEAFVTEPIAGETPVRKIACFESQISRPHISWLNSQGIGAIWKEDGAFAGDGLAHDFLGAHLEEFS